MKDDEFQADEMIDGDEEYITLKEAAKISGYSADYIGQLIRKGKIPGRQVYTNIAWVTTEEAIRTYLSGDATKRVTGTQEDSRKGYDLNVRTWYEKVLARRGIESSIRLVLYTLLFAVILALILTILTWYSSFSQSILGHPGTYERTSVARIRDVSHYRDPYGK